MSCLVENDQRKSGNFLEERTFDLLLKEGKHTLGGEDTPPTSSRVISFQNDEDPSFLELLFQYGRYLLIACSRPGTQVANLQGMEQRCGAGMGVCFAFFFTSPLAINKSESKDIGGLNSIAEMNGVPFPVLTRHGCMLLYIPGAFLATVIGMLVDVPVISFIAVCKGPYMLFKGWHRLFHDLVGREGPFLETIYVPFAGLAILLWPLVVAGAVLASILASYFLGAYAGVVAYQVSLGAKQLIYHLLQRDPSSK
ncbi:hypothetical protein P8452_75849 [Trifolium repens]|nr:hypothetical protein P8452_75849 [Trifolium repens]